MRSYIFSLKHYITIFIVFTIFAGCNNKNGTQNGIIVFAAASLTDAVGQLNRDFEREHPGLKVDVNIGSSALLAKQITHSSQADIFLSANIKWMDYLEMKGFIRREKRFSILGNRLALITSNKNSNPVTSLTGLIDDRIKFIAVADYNSVPAGIYAKSALIKAGLWQSIKPKLVSGNDVRTAMAYVERGETEYGIVYLTDAKVSSNVKIVFTLPDEIQPDIRYSFSITENAPNVSDAIILINYLKSDTAREVFEEYGFKWIYRSRE